MERVVQAGGTADLVMSLTESPDNVERLALVRVRYGWSYVKESASAVGLRFGSVAPVTVAIVIVPEPAR